MFLVIPFFLIIVFYVLKAFHQEMERLDQIRLNATMRNMNATLLGDDFDDAWLTYQVIKNISDREGADDVKLMKIEPNWEVVLGTFEHYKDENFEEFLIAAGAPYFVRSMLLSTTPVVTVDRVFKDDYYYYEIYDDYEEPDYDHHDYPDGNRVYQIVLTSVTWMRTHVERFRLGYSFRKHDMDGSESKNTYTFVAPDVLMHKKESERLTANIVRKFNEDGIVMTIFNQKTGMVAKRHYRRLGEEEQSQK